MTSKQTLDYLPNALSASRLLVALIMVWAIFDFWWNLAVLLFLIAVATDLLDGYLARRFNATSTFGGLLDHGSDAAFVVITLIGLAWVKGTSMLLPLLITLAFAQYALDSKVQYGRPLIASRLGRYNGIAYFVYLGSAVGVEALAPQHDAWRQIIVFAEILLILTTSLSIADRLKRSLSA